MVIMEKTEIEDRRLADACLILDGLGVSIVEVDVSTGTTEEQAGLLRVYAHLRQADTVISLRVQQLSADIRLLFYAIQGGVQLH